MLKVVTLEDITNKEKQVSIDPEKEYTLYEIQKHNLMLLQSRKWLYEKTEGGNLKFRQGEIPVREHYKKSIRVRKILGKDILKYLYLTSKYKLLIDHRRSKDYYAIKDLFLKNENYGSEN